MPNHPVLVPELLTLEERKNGATLVVEAPQRNGFHDDISDAFARAVWAAYNSKRSSNRKITLSLSNNSAGSYRSFYFNRLKQHGDNPRNIGM